MSVKIFGQSNNQRGHELHLYVPYKILNTKPHKTHAFTFPVFIKYHTDKPGKWWQIDICILGFGFSYSRRSK